MVTSAELKSRSFQLQRVDLLSQIVSNSRRDQSRREIFSKISYDKGTRLMNELTLSHVLQCLQQRIDALIPLQVDTPDHPAYGGIVHPEFGIATPQPTAEFVTGCAYLSLGNEHADESLLDQAILAMEYLLNVQHENGLVDLPAVNYDSSPDTGFIVQKFCPIIELGRVQRANHPQWNRLLEKIECFIRRTIPGLLIGGFHTPNHRWVITSALVQAHALFPDLDVKTTVEAYLAEEFDIDEEGTFIERSIGVYDAVNTRALLFIEKYWGAPTAMEAVNRNLTFNLHLLHSDGTAETGLSHRQDFGTREVTTTLIANYLLSNQVSPNPVFVKAAQTLWEKATHPENHLTWICHALLTCGDPKPQTVSLPENFSNYYPKNGLWRVRRNRMSASVFKDTTRLMTLIYGTAELTSVKISQTYFGQYIGRFVSNDLQVEANQAMLRSEGKSNPRRPAYELPLGRPVPHDQWAHMIEERDLRWLPPALSTLKIQEVEGGFDLHYQTLDGLPGVCAQMAFDFLPGGVWETEDTKIMPVAGQIIFLKQGLGTMRYGNDVIQISPGTYAHGMWHMRDAEPAPNHVRILLTFFTPVKSTIKLRCYRGLTPKM